MLAKGTTIVVDKNSKTFLDRQGSATSPLQSSKLGKSMLGTDAIKLENVKPQKSVKEMSSFEKFSQVEIKPIEKIALDKVFNRLCRATPKKDGVENYFVAEDIVKVLTELRFKMTRQEIDLMIWEVDENLDKRVEREEFDLMFRRCITNETELDPKSLFNLVRFLMYAKEGAIEITEEDALELIYVRKNNMSGLEEALKVIFEESERSYDGIEKKVTFEQFLDRRNRKALEIKRYKKQQQKEARNTLIKKDKGY